MTRHFLEIDDVAPAELASILQFASTPHRRVLDGHGVALVMGLPSARTRNSTEMAVVDLGGHPVAMSGAELGIDSRETAEDVARTLAQYHRVLCARLPDHGVLVRMAAAIDEAGLDVPVVNLLSDQGHPVQALADLLTLAGVAGGIASLAGSRVAWVGDANNVAMSLGLAAVGVGLHVVVASPEGYRFSQGDLARIDRYAAAAGMGGTVSQADHPADAVGGAIAVCTDVWVSMGQEREREARLAAFEPFRVDGSLLDAAGDGVVLLHCLPAHRGEEVTDEVLEDRRSRVWAQAANRRVAMRGLLTWLVEEAR
ncbi:MAG TPA: ornithine carbamoyltransferase [Acidimicrobiales bacterium]|jgi:ornithine carbamoyltransferase